MRTVQAQIVARKAVSPLDMRIPASRWAQGRFCLGSGASAVERVLGLIAAGLVAVIRLIGAVVAFAFRTLRGLLPSKSRVFLCLAVALALCAGIGIDAAVNGSTMRAGVSIGEVDVSGMTREQALDAVNATYESRLSQGSAVVFSDEETAASVDLAAQLAQDDAIAEQISFDEAQKSKKLWQVDASSLGAVLPSYQLVDEAFSIGRGPADAFERIGAAFGGASVDVRLDFDDVRLERARARHRSGDRRRPRGLRRSGRRRGRCRRGP